MTQLANLLQTKRVPFRVYKPLRREIPLLCHIEQSIKNQSTQLKYSCDSPSPLKNMPKSRRPKLSHNFNVCASKDVFVFTLKQLPVQTPRTAKLKQNKRLRVTEQLFCQKNEVRKRMYRTIVRSCKTSRQKSQLNSEQKLEVIEIHKSMWSSNPEPWQMNDQEQDFYKLF